MKTGRQEMINGFFCKQRKSGLNGSEGAEPFGCKVALVNINAAIEAYTHVFIKLGIAFY